MSQNLASTHLDDAQWAGIDQSLDTLEAAVAPILVAINGHGERRRLAKMGDGSEAFCRKAYDAMHANRALLPPALDVEEMGRDLRSHDALNARITRVVRLLEKMRDTDTALGSDVMVAALAGYHLLKYSKGEGLDALNREMGKRFEGNGRREEAEAPVA